MSDTPYQRKRDFHGAVSGDVRVLASSTGLIPLVPTIPQYTIFVQTIHVEVTAPTAAELWTLQDGAGVPLVPAVSAAAVAHFDFDFGPDGVPCAVGSRFDLKITGAVGAVGWITWEGYKQFTLGASYAQSVLDLGPTNYFRLNEKSGLIAVDGVGGKNGTISGGVTLGQPGATADGDRAMTFDGATGQIVTTAVTLPVTCTIDLWINTSYAGGYKPILTIRPEDTFQLAIPNSPNVGQVRVWTGVFSMGVRIVNDGRWHYIAVGLSGTDCLIYIDGTLDTNTPNARGVQTGPLKIGVDSVDGSFWLGGLDEIAIYPYVLTAQQIGAKFQAASR